MPTWNKHDLNDHILSKIDFLVKKLFTNETPLPHYARYLRKKIYLEYTNSKETEKRDHFSFVCLNKQSIKNQKDITRKLQTNIAHEHRCKYPQQSFSKYNPTICKKDNKT